MVSRVCFTLNNWTNSEYSKLVTSVVGWCKYFVVGKETGEEGTPHLQGFLILKRRQRLSALTNKMNEAIGFKRPKKPRKTNKNYAAAIAKYNAAPKGRFWTAAARGTNDEAATYCKKEADFFEEGEYPRKAGERTDIHDFMDAVREGQDDDVLMEMFPSQWLKYHKAAEKGRRVMRRKRTRKELEDQYSDAKLRTWQQLVLNKLMSQDNRTVTWVYDPQGNIGKSWFAGYLGAKHNAFLIDSGKRADVAFAYNYEPNVVFDFTRSQEEFVSYSLVESFKNGRIFSTKYESELKQFPPANVLCLSNFYPDKSKLSEDRWQILEFPDIEQHDDEPPRKRRKMNNGNAKPMLQRNDCKCANGLGFNCNCGSCNDFLFQE